LKPDNTDIYHRWKQQRCDVPVPPGFSNRVMALIDQQPQKDRLPRMMNFRSRVTVLVFRWALGSALLLVGIFRISFVTIQLLIP
jgi:hypothetical protein